MENKDIERIMKLLSRGHLGYDETGSVAYILIIIHSNLVLFNSV